MRCLGHISTLVILSAFYIHHSSAENNFRLNNKRKSILYSRNPLALVILFHRNNSVKDSKKIDSIHYDKNFDTEDGRQFNDKYYRYDNGKERDMTTDTNDDTSESSDDSEITLENLDRNVVRSLWKGCYKKGVDRFRKACTRALKYVCNSFKCDSKEKRYFEVNCKDTCKHQFRMGKRM